MSAAGARRRRGGKAAVAAVEFALVAPTLLILGAGVLDAGYAFSTKIRVTNAASIAAIYAYENGQGLTSAQIPTVLTQIQSVAQNSETFITPPTVAVNYNTPLTGGAGGQVDTTDNWCITSPAAGSWVKTTTPTCAPPQNGGANLVTPGVFITLSVTESFVPIFGFDAPVFGGLKISSAATVRVQ